MKKKKPQKNVDENELLKVIDIISKKLAYKFKFGYHEIEDMKQQISIFALEGLKNYDHTRPLENFLWTHVRNRLFNYKRDNYQRPDKPCLSCPLYDINTKSQCSKYNDKNDCVEYHNWYNRNNIKKNLMHLTTIDEIKDYSSAFINSETELTETIGSNEILDIIDSHLTGEYRINYLKLRSGGKVSKSDTEKLIKKIQQIIAEHKDG